MAGKTENSLCDILQYTADSSTGASDPSEFRTFYLRITGIYPSRMFVLVVNWRLVSGLYAHAGQHLTLMHRNLLLSACVPLSPRSNSSTQQKITTDNRRVPPRIIFYILCFRKNGCIAVCSWAAQRLCDHSLCTAVSTLVAGSVKVFSACVR